MPEWTDHEILRHCVRRMQNALISLGAEGCARDEGARAQELITKLEAVNG